MAFELVLITHTDFNCKTVDVGHTKSDQMFIELPSWETYTCSFFTIKNPSEVGLSLQFPLREP